MLSTAGVEASGAWPPGGDCSSVRASFLVSMPSKASRHYETAKYCSIYHKMGNYHSEVLNDSATKLKEEPSEIKLSPLKRLPPRQRKLRKILPPRSRNPSLPTAPAIQEAP